MDLELLMFLNKFYLMLDNW